MSNRVSTHDRIIKNRLIRRKKRQDRVNAGLCEKCGRKNPTKIRTCRICQDRDKLSDRKKMQERRERIGSYLQEAKQWIKEL